ncbi:unnamed protein product [Anisakis simplex]|uniref:Protein TolB n=1 Tax=Anisakis simplex TaxID=6269 RepID=A0A0M3K5W9_ANISI|nr:unnamed protein product [Anisakis simplex]
MIQATFHFVPLTLCYIISLANAELPANEEKYLKNIKQLTWGCENVAPTFSKNGENFLYQGGGKSCYGTCCAQIYKLSLKEPTSSQTAHRISNGMGLASRPKFDPKTEFILFASTSLSHRYADNIHYCPQKVCASNKIMSDPILKDICNRSFELFSGTSAHTWELFPEYEIFSVNRFGNAFTQLTNEEGYDADADISPDGQKIVFTSMRSGDPEIWIMDATGLNEKQLTNELGFEVSPRTMNLYIMNVNGSDIKQITKLGGAIITPYFLKDDRRIVFASNFESFGRQCGDFSLYVIDVDGKNLKRITANAGGFDGYPTFDATGKHLMKVIFISLLFTLGRVSFCAEVESRREKHLKNIRQMTWGGENEDPVISADGKWFIYLGSGIDQYGLCCEQVYKMRTDKPGDQQTAQRMSPGLGLAAGPAIFPDQENLLVATTVVTTQQKTTMHGCPRRLCLTDVEKNATKIEHTCKKLPDLDYIESDGTEGLIAYSIDPFEFLEEITASIHFSLETHIVEFFKKRNCELISKNSNENKHSDHLYQCSYSHIVFIQSSHITRKFSGREGLTWDIFPEFDIFKVNKYGNAIAKLTKTLGYDSEADISPDGQKIVFTSMRSGDPEIWIMNADGSNAKQLTHELGYDGGAKFSHDGKQIVFRASRPKTADDIRAYKRLLSDGRVSPLAMEIFIMDVDGSNKRQLTNLGGVNYTPMFMNGDKRIIFSSNSHAIEGCHDFDLFTIDTDGKDLQRVTIIGHFNAFPRFDKDQKTIMWSSDRNSTVVGEANIMIADWVD